MKRTVPILSILLCVLFSTSIPSLAYEARTINDGWTFRYENDTTSSAVHLPHSWNKDAYSTSNYKRGTGYYTRIFETPKDIRGKQVYLKLDGAANKSEVLIDGVSVGTHIGGYSPHVINITPYIKAGGNHQLTVTVDNSDKDIPPYSADFTFMGGLYRDVWLITSDDTHFSIEPENSIKITPKVFPGGRCAISIDGSVMNMSQRKTRVLVNVQLISPEGKIVASKSEKVFLRKNKKSSDFSISLTNLPDIKLWTPESPNLYSVKVSLKESGRTLDSIEETTGFRTFAFGENGEFLLNGKPYKLRGMCRHQDQAPMGIALTDEQHRRDMQMIKDLGANFIRISHYPQDDAILEMCDRLGLIAWEEIPVIDYVPDSENFADNCEVMLRDMIRDHYNHPSIAMWGYMNEILLRMPYENKDSTIARTLALAERLEKVVREEDPHRLTSMAFHGSDIYNETGLADITDVRGWNLYSGWYGGNLDDFGQYLSRQHQEHPDHRLIVSEYGAGSDLRIHSLEPEAFDFSMEYQQKFLEHYLPVIEDSTFVAGASHWNFIDFSSANRAESMPHINNKGLVTNDRRKKDVYYYYQAAWHDIDKDTVAHIASRDWQQRTEIFDESGYISRPLKVYTNLPSLVIKVNGRHYQVNDIKNHTAQFEALLQPGINTIEIFAENDTNTPLDAMTLSVAGIDSRNGIFDLGTAELGINVGSNCYFRSDASGQTWLPDKEYQQGGLYGHTGGRRSVTQDEIQLTDDPLFQHALYGLDEYRIDVSPGRYEVELSFADMASPSAMSAYMLGHNAGSGDNVPANMDISINGKDVETGFSPGAISGVKSMVKRRYLTEVGDESHISVRFSPLANGSTLLSSIKIRKL